MWGHCMLPTHFLHLWKSLNRTRSHLQSRGLQTLRWGPVPAAPTLAWLMKGLVPSLMSTAEAERSFFYLKLIKTSKKHHSHVFSVLFAGLSAFLLWHLGQMITRLWCCWKDSLFSFMNRSRETAVVNIGWRVRYSNYNISVQATLDTAVVFLSYLSPFHILR